MQETDCSVPLERLCRYDALPGLTQAPGLAGGHDFCTGQMAGILPFGLVFFSENRYAIKEALARCYVGRRMIE